MPNDMNNVENPTNRIAIFKGKSIRKIIYHKEWWFSVLDVIHAITDSPQPKTYWAKMKDRDKSLSELFPFWEQLKLAAKDGKMRSKNFLQKFPAYRTGGSWKKVRASEYKDTDVYV